VTDRANDLVHEDAPGVRAILGPGDGKSVMPTLPVALRQLPRTSPKRRLEMAARAALAEVGTVVVKVGSSSLTTNGRLADEKIARVADQVLAASQQGRRVILVSSGAILSGTAHLRLEKRPRTMPMKQALAAVGNVLLMERYHHYFEDRGQPVALVLLTRYDVSDRHHYLNARNTLSTLLDLGVLPIVNENDTVATDEIKFGDNDNLSATVANLVGAELLVILSDVGGLHPHDPRLHPQSRSISFIERIDDTVFAMAGGSDHGVGGMMTKVQAASAATQGGCAVVVTDAAAPDALVKILAGERIGTLFAPQGERLGSRKRWLAAGLGSKGQVRLDAGACRALLEQGRSLLPVGVTAVDGSFEAGDLVTLLGPGGTSIGSGLTNYSSAQLAAILGKHTNELDPEFDFDEVIHRNNMLLWHQD
jgi:glutamate 5-kinase